MGASMSNIPCLIFSLQLCDGGFYNILTKHACIRSQMYKEMFAVNKETRYLTREI